MKNKTSVMCGLYVAAALLGALAATTRGAGLDADSNLLREGQASLRVFDPATQEELQNWIVCASLYWKVTGDNAWLEQNKGAFKLAPESMQRRDDVDPAKRDGITTYVSNLGAKTNEITTYDAMDASLRSPTDSLYIAFKSFACYTMMQSVCRQLGENAAFQQAQAAEAYTAKGILSHWDEQRHSFPATFDARPASVTAAATMKAQAID